MSDVITDLRSQLEKRLRELAPHVREHARINAALEKLTSTVSPGGRTRPGKAVARATAQAPTPRRKATVVRSGRPRTGQPNRRDQFLQVVQANPGITVSDAAKQMGIGPNYVYRIRNDLLKAGTIKKQGKGFAVK